MKKFYLTLFIFTATLFYSVAQTYLISDGGTHSTCTGTFYDDGGAAGNYSDNANDTITFCSSNGARILVTFSSMQIQNGDYLYVWHGDQAVGTPDFTNPGTGAITSNCGCLTFVFVSNASTNRAGWQGTVSCASTPPVSNDYIYNATSVNPNGSCLTGQTNVNTGADYTYGCFTSGNTVWYEVDLTGGFNQLSVTLQNAAFANVEYLIVYGDPCHTATLGTYTGTGAQCGLSSDTITWTDLDQSLYYIGVSSVTEGTFDICFTESYVDVCGDYYCGSGETCNSCPFDCGACPETIGGPYFHPAVGVQNTYLGQCMVSTCSGTYYDNGGPGVAYSNNINQIYRTFCPDSPLMAVRATINSMQIEYQTSPAGCVDQLWVQNGPTQNSPTIWSGCGNTSVPQIYNTAGLYNGGVFTSSHTSGCLTFRFNSGAANAGYWEGWDITLSCVPFPSGPDGTYNSDCVNATPICDDITIQSEVWGPGLDSEGCGSCVTSENFTEWYWVRVLTSGTMEFEISPQGNSDMDFAIYRANDCGSLGMPVRCSYAAYASPGKTGLSSAAGDLSEDVYGDQWVAELPIIAGEIYYIMINEWNKLNPNAYNIDFTLTDGASFDCSIVLPIDLVSLKASCLEQTTRVTWETASELNNDYFTLERSFNGLNFETIATVEGAGTSNELKKYFYEDNLYPSTVYYRLKQTDFNGESSTSEVISVTCDEDRQFNLTIGDSSNEGYIDIIHDAVINTSYLLTFTDAQGKIVYFRHYTADTEVINEKIESNMFAPGIYFINITSSVNNHSQKIMIR
jgi:hypothetical protein